MTQSKNFDEHQDREPSQLEQPSFYPSPKREQIKHVLIGSPQVVTSTIHYLQVIGYARIVNWSPLIPTGNLDEVMSILIRQILSFS